MLSGRVLRTGVVHLRKQGVQRTSVPKACSSTATDRSIFRTTDEFVERHIGPSEGDVADMLRVVGCTSLEELVDRTVPASIRLGRELGDPVPEEGMTESEALAELRAMVSKNKVAKPLIGMGYSGTLTPAVILRNMIENPGWYTAYTPYQAEIAQGRLEMLLNFQTLVADLTGLPVANASLLDEATAAAEAMSLCFGHSRSKRARFVVADDVFPQTLDVIRTRAAAIGVTVDVQDAASIDTAGGDVCGVLIQYPNVHGDIADSHADTIAAAHANGALVVAATDLLSLTLLTPPGELGADIAVGSAQRFGVPLGFGGPHAAFMAVTEEHQRKIPGRIIGVSKDARGKRALRMALQTREQHIRRDKATSNICTAQALLANVAAAYAIYHGPEGLREIATRVNAMTRALGAALSEHGYELRNARAFDALTVDVGVAGRSADDVLRAADALGVALRRAGDGAVGVALDETVTGEDLRRVAQAFGVPFEAVEAEAEAAAAAAAAGEGLGAMRRASPYLAHEVFHAHRSETRMLRYLHALEAKDLSLNASMIPLGSCTMKLNATSEMMPISWPEVNQIHPFAPVSHTAGYRSLIDHLNRQLAEITGFAAVSAQPNSGAQGEYAGLMCIRAFHEARGEGHRDVCLIPTSAHGTNPASAVMCGMRVVSVKNDADGNVDLADLRAKAEKHAGRLGALMVTYPSTYGVFEPAIREAIDCVHEHGGQVYMDGANMNAQVALTSPGEIGADVCHLNLHKTFCIPHGGGGPGVGSIGVAAHLAPFLPGHAVVPVGGEGDGVEVKDSGAIAAAPYGSASILPISWMYINMMGRRGLTRATQVAILNANYMAARIQGHFDVLFRGAHGMVAHEFIVDVRPFKEHGIAEEDVAKRLMDFGFHAPTMSWPVGGTLMVEPTESEDKAELDRFCEALIAIRAEIQDVVDGKVAVEASPLKHAPHTADQVLSDAWDRPYPRETAAYPLPWVRERKFWPSVSRIDNVYGDRHLICTCPSVEDVAEE